MLTLKKSGVKFKTSLKIVYQVNNFLVDGPRRKFSGNVVKMTKSVNKHYLVNSPLQRKNNLKGWLNKF